MFRLIRWLFSLVIFAIVFWFATTIPLGNKTLWGHLRAIFGTQEAKDLAKGAEDEAKKVADRMRDQAHKEQPDLGGPHSHAPLDPVDAKDQKDLDKLVHDKTKKKK